MNEFVTVTVDTAVLDAQITNLITALNVLVVSHQELAGRVAKLEGSAPADPPPIDQPPVDTPPVDPPVDNPPDPAPVDALTDEDGAALIDENGAVLTGDADG